MFYSTIIFISFWHKEIIFKNLPFLDPSKAITPLSHKNKKNEKPFFYSFPQLLLHETTLSFIFSLLLLHFRYNGLKHPCCNYNKPLVEYVFLTTTVTHHDFRYNTSIFLKNSYQKPDSSIIDVTWIFPQIRH